MAALIRLYLPACGDDPLLFLRLEQYQNVCHPMRALALATLLKRLRITHVHAHGSTYPATRAMIASALLDVSFSFSTFVDFDYDSDFKLLDEKVERAEFVVATTRFCVDRLVALTAETYRSKIHTVYLSIDPDYGREGLAPAPVPTILSVCRFVKKKGLDYLLRACAVLRERGLSIHCLLVGDGPEKDRLVALAEALDLAGLVEFTGPVSNATVRELMTRADLLVAPSVYAGDGERDGIPTVLLEAMTYAIPVISTPVSGIPELVVHEQNGLLVPERDEVALADAMERLLRDPTLRASLGRRGRERVLADFNIRDSSRRLWSLIDRAGRPSWPTQPH
jgi:glycosyltransferase involved in cell wall biosynthesis